VQKKGNSLELTSRFSELPAITQTTNKTTNNGSGRACMAIYGQSESIAAKHTGGE